MKNLLLITALLSTISLLAQKKTLDHNAYRIWKKIDNTKISNDGNWVVYATSCNADCDVQLQLWNAKTEQTRTFERGYDAQFSFDNSHLVFKIKQPLDSLKAKRRKKVKDDDLPKDSLGILSLATGELVTVGNIKSYALPQKWAGFVAYHLDIEKANERPTPSVSKDNSAEKDSAKAKPRPKAESKDNGSKLIVLNLTTGKKDTFPFAVDYTFSKKGKRLLVADTGKGDTTDLASVDVFNAENGLKQVIFQQNKAKFKQLALDEQGNQAAFIADLDTTKERVRPNQLHYWAVPRGLPLANAPLASGGAIAKSFSNFGTLKNYLVSDNVKPIFSEDGSKLFFGIAPQPVLNDTTLLPEEIVNVEVWAYSDSKIHPQQKVQLENEKKRSYTVVANVGNGTARTIVPLASPDMPDVAFTQNRNIDFAIGTSDEAYQLAATWEGFPRRDVYVVDTKTGNRTLAKKGIRGQAQISPSGKYIYGYNAIDSAWFAYSTTTKKGATITDNKTVQFYEDENDMPDYPSGYGLAGWSKDDKYLIVNDKYDLWRIDPLNIEKPVCLTKGEGRAKKTVYRNIRLDDEERDIDLSKPLMLHATNEDTKAEGYVSLDANTGVLKPIFTDDYRFTPQPLKAKNSDVMVFTKQNFQTFPDLRYADSNKKVSNISDVNPQQKEYGWGSMELVEWRSLNGEKLRGMLVKPADFDPKKKYPMIVYFYEKSSNELHNYSGPQPTRASINYAFYASRGYIIFNPDIPYRIGYPGESCVNAVVSGVTHLIEQGFVDEKNIGVQGHSWGGYQIAYLLTRTNIFKCAESGAPVVNMISAYGGIRWETGILRQFQYEHTQSRIAGTPWEYPLRFIENSPIFTADKIQTPVLVMANDKDGAVPWYQGIEFYSAMRRMNKPAWLLNYNDEGHGLTKLQNRMDFTVRMQQFFDHYLKGAPMPKWMQSGVSAMDKGINQHLELVEEKK
jgi:dipeptidyl aminopeptidase/acylaminoacyl peptidase